MGSVCCHFFVFGSTHSAGVRAGFSVSVLSVVRVLGSQLFDSGSNVPVERFLSTLQEIRCSEGD